MNEWPNKDDTRISSDYTVDTELVSLGGSLVLPGDLCPLSD